ncbi:hypothetical protein BV898_18443 [Hypsibius exemplaris]|uniref:Uncharacterized protein n=1 Tax=Hypsibius exemplaris TaxID=2072580 RepID=A0A9X6RNG8_HYPEX|nr:hypothetical protein BV898_18443 [Hypsibius exemplaris]
MDSGSDINKDQYERPSVTSMLSVGPYTTRQFLLLVQDSQATRRKRVLRLLFVMCVPILVLILQCAVTMLSASTTKVTSSNTALAITSSVQVGEVITRLARERGMTSSSDPWNNLVKLRASSDHAIAVVILWPGNSEDLPALRSPHALRHTLQTHRIDRSSNRTSISEVYWRHKGPAVAAPLCAGVIVNAKESLGIQRAIGSTIFSKGQGSTEEYNTFNENYFKARTFLEICFSHSGRSKALYDALLSDKADLTSRIASMRDAILQKQKNPRAC